MRLESSPRELRRIILQMAYSGNSVHIACAFSLVEVFYALYRDLVDCAKVVEQSPDRDFVCLSKGHGVMAQYACLHKIGIVSDQEINGYFSDGSRLTGLSEAHVPGVEVSGGSLGQGITVATGIALSKKRSGSKARVFCIVGDGEMNAGSVWESLLICAHQQLSNFTLIVDANDFQATGRCEDILSLEPFFSKLTAFNFEVRECDGHDVRAISSALAELAAIDSGRPRALIARTVKGKGVSFMERDNVWHYTRLNRETFESALKEVQG